MVRRQLHQQLAATANNNTMSHCHDRRRRSRRQLIIIGSLLHLAIISVATLSPTFTTAFAPPAPLSRKMSFSATSSTYPQRRKTGTIMRAKKRQRKKSSSSSGDDEDVNYRESAQKFSKKDSGDSDDDVDDDEQTTTTDEDNNNSSKEAEAEQEGTMPNQTTLSGGPSLIFEMARRMLVWDDELYDNSQIVNDAGGPRREGGGMMENMETTAPLSLSTEFLNTLSPIPSSTSSSSSSSIPPIPNAAAVSASPPRWRPSAIRQQSISDVNLSFRTSSPIMTNAGYAGILRRNSRKKNKPSMWRHCLRIYGRMAELEKESEAAAAAASGSGGSTRPEDGIGVDKRSENEGDSNVSASARPIPGVGTNLAPSVNPRNNASGGGRRKKMKIRRSTAHHEAALVAASKLGLWEEALLIFRGVEESCSPSNNARAAANRNNGGVLRKVRNRVTDNMILSVVSACVKGSRVKRTASSTPTVVGNAVSTNPDSDDNAINATSSGNATNLGNMTYTSPSPPSFRPMMRALTIEERRKPLDSARDIVLSMEEKHDIPLVSRHINQLASAYNRLGLRLEATALINDHLKDRTPPPPPPPTKRNLSSKKYKRKEKRELYQKSLDQRELIISDDNPGFKGVKLIDWNEDDLDDDNDDDLLDDGYEEIQLNIHQVKSKDRASYSLLVQGAAMEGDWASAVQELQRMTDAGLHPNSRNLNSWSEVMERGCRPSGNGDQNNSDKGLYYYGGRPRRRSWKKKRDGIWLDN